MIDLKSEFKHLLQVVADYHAGKPERLTDVIYLWWKVYHLINCKLKEAQTFPEKEAVIEEFKCFSKELNQLYDELPGTKMLGNENSEDVDPDSPAIPLVLSNLLKMLYVEREALAATMKALKKEKTRKKPKIRSARKGKSGWIRE